VLNYISIAPNGFNTNGIAGGCGVEVYQSHNGYIGGSTWRNCEVILDGLHWSDMTFIHVLVHYNGGSTELKNCRFVDCIFDVHITVVSSPEGQVITRQLLMTAKSTDFKVD